MSRKDQIINEGEFVYRPASHWTKDVHKFLGYLDDKNFNAAPKPLGFDKAGREIVSFIKGDVSNYPLTSNAASTQALTSAAVLLRRYHDASTGFLGNNEAVEGHWQLPCRYPVEVICHGDYAPYNVVLNGKKAIGIIDFDTAHPGPRSWDIAYALYRWAPLTNPENQDGFGSLKNQVARAALFCNFYSLSQDERINMASLIIERLQSLLNFMYKEAEEGNEIMKANIADGHHILYIKDIEYIKIHTTYINDKLYK
ncbi:MAG: aminoglycoside phosphotransferase family protein [Rickettsiaceae bacterium]|nr:MAG: aminoglycoside phosphotransferase family protein [Rickettsiaceae bacterium]